MSEQYFVDLKDLAHDKISFEARSSRASSISEPKTSGRSDIWTGPRRRSAPARKSGSPVRSTRRSKCRVRDVWNRRELTSASRSIFSFASATKRCSMRMRSRTRGRDTRTSFFTGTQLAIGDILREQVLLALPMKVLCRVDCKGLCPVCGTNLNFNSCNCPTEQFSPHMDKLLEIKRQLEERSS